MRLKLLTEADLFKGKDDLGLRSTPIDQTAAQAKGSKVHDFNPVLRAFGSYIHPNTGNHLWAVVKWKAHPQGGTLMSSAQVAQFERIKPEILKKSTNKERVRTWFALQPDAAKLFFREYNDDLLQDPKVIEGDLDLLTFKPEVEFDAEAEPIEVEPSFMKPAVPTTPRAAPGAPTPTPAPAPEAPPGAPPRAQPPQGAEETPPGEEPQGEEPEGEEGPSKPPVKPKEVGEPKAPPARGFRPTSAQRRRQKTASDQGEKGGALSWLFRGIKNIGAAARRFLTFKS